MGESRIMWEPTPETIQNSNMMKFINVVNANHQLNIGSYGDLYQWSVDHLSDFWGDLWDFLEIKASRKFDRVVDDATIMPGAKWFEGARLNFAENLLRFRDDQVALVFRGEAVVTRKLTYADLFERVAKLSNTLREYGIKPGDRVAGFIPNMPEAIIAMLAAVSVGATWSSCSPDFGINGVFDRFGQIQPRILFIADGYYYKNKKLSSLERVAGIVEKIPSIEKVIVIPYTEADPDIGIIPNAVAYENFVAGFSGEKIEFEQLPPDQPLYIMYSSGTTGLPKCMVQGTAGILINQMKEMRLNTDLKREDTIFYFTTCGWMMWNWLTSALSIGATLVLYDGNPFYPDASALWKMADEEKITVFGTSAGYLQALEASGIKPGALFDLSSIRTILSTGSPLSPEQFDFVHREIKEDVQLASISGGSDLNGCFVGANPIGPVFRGELQARCLGMKVKAYNENGEPVIGEKGELVCEAPFPSMPIYFWNDPDGSRYQSAYFDKYPNIWCHGDYINITDTGGVVIHGRSDATLNPGGVRIGTAEIYRQIESFDEIQDSVVVGQKWKGDVRVILFVLMKGGYTLTDDLKAKIRTAIKLNASPRHIPSKIIEVEGIPYTLNMKKVEVAVRKVIHNEKITNRDALSNPEALEYYKDIPELQS